MGSEVQQLLHANRGDAAAQIRNYAMLVLLAVYGFRSAEVCGPTLDDIYWEHERIHPPRPEQRKVAQYLKLHCGTRAGLVLGTDAGSDWALRAILGSRRPMTLLRRNALTSRDVVWYDPSFAARLPPFDGTGFSYLLLGNSGSPVSPLTNNVQLDESDARTFFIGPTKFFSAAITTEELNPLSLHVPAAPRASCNVIGTLILRRCGIPTLFNHRPLGGDTMTRSKGIRAHKVFKLGKASAKRDRRNLKFATLLRAAAQALPASYDFDTSHPGIPTPMFANDLKGDCVIAGRAHQTLRFEDIEQGSVLMISDKEVLKEYFKETGGADTGLVVLDSLNLWRHKGWRVGTHTYKILAFAEVTFSDRNQVRQAVFANVGVGLGVQLPIAAQTQIQTGQPWDVTTGPNAKPGSWGGHYVYVPGYTPKGPVCVTWGRKQQMTWAWVNKYCDEAYAIFDANNRFKKAMIDKAKITAFLDTLE